jgi:ectoine hydroxylase-related dioxygenase (phytanoyl-CoA dioxygenase family)
MLTAEELEAYRRDGYLVRRAVFSADEVEAVAAETDALLERKDLMAQNNLRVRWQYHCDTGEPIFELFDPITDLAPRCDNWLRDPRLTNLAAAALSDRVHPIKDKIIYKPSGAGGYPLHQDYIAWPTFPKSFTTIVVAIDDADEHNGCIELYPGAHAKGCLAELDGNFHMLPDECVSGFERRAVPLRAGDVLMFGAFMPHRSGGNRSPRRRRHLLFSYNADRDGGDLRRDHYQGFHHWLRSMYGMMGLGDLYFR